MDELAGFALLLRALAHGALGWVPGESRLHVKRILAEHAADDLSSVGRLEHLVRPAPAPGPALAVIVEALAGATEPAEYQRISHGTVKPALARAVRTSLARKDPRLPEVPALMELAIRQERHADELLVRHAPPLEGGLRVDVDRTTRWSPGILPVRPPRRDPFVPLGAGTGDRHAAMNAELLAGEVAARTAHERIDGDPVLRADLARIAADRLHRAAIVDAELLHSGHPWGARPVDVSPYLAALGGDVHSRLVYATVPGDDVHDDMLSRHRQL